MILPEKSSHPKGETELSLNKREIASLVADTFDGKIHIKWGSSSALGKAALILWVKVPL